MNRYKLNFYSKKYQELFLYIFILTPIIIFISKFLADFFLSLISIYVLIFLVKNKKISLLKYFLFFFIFVIYISLNLLIFKPDILLIIKSFLLIRFPLFILFPFIFNFENKFLSKKFKLIFIFPIVIFLVNLYFQTFLNFDIFGKVLVNDYQRVTSFFGNEYIAGSYLFFIFTIILLITDDFNIPKLLLLITIYFGILFSGDRTPFLIVNLFLGLLFLMNIKKLVFSQKFIMLFIFVSLSIFSLILLDSKKIINIAAFEKYKGTYKNIVKDIQQKKNNENNLGLKRWAYYGLYTKSIVIFKNNTLFGTTYKSFRIECANKRYDNDHFNITGGLTYKGCSTHPHNIYLEILSEQGIFGFSLFIFLIYNFFQLTKRINNLNYINYKIFLIVYFFPLKPFGSFYTNFNLIMFSATIALFVIFNKNKQLNKQLKKLV